MRNKDEKKKSTLDWVLLVVAVVFIIGGVFATLCGDAFDNKELGTVGLMFTFMGGVYGLIAAERW